MYYINAKVLQELLNKQYTINEDTEQQRSNNIVMSVVDNVLQDHPYSFSGYKNRWDNAHSKNSIYYKFKTTILERGDVLINTETEADRIIFGIVTEGIILAAQTLHILYNVEMYASLKTIIDSIHAIQQIHGYFCTYEPMKYKTDEILVSRDLASSMCNCYCVATALLCWSEYENKIVKIVTYDNRKVAVTREEDIIKLTTDRLFRIKDTFDKKEMLAYVRLCL